MVTRDDEILNVLSRIVEEQRDSRAEMTKAFSDMDKKVELHIQKTEYELKGIHQQDAIQNQLLDQHIEGVNTLKKMFELHEKNDVERFGNLEEPRKFVRTAVKVVLWLGALGTAVAGIIEVMSRLKGQ